MTPPYTDLYLNPHHPSPSCDTTRMLALLVGKCCNATIRNMPLFLIETLHQDTMSSYLFKENLCSTDVIKIGISNYHG